MRGEEEMWRGTRHTNPSLLPALLAATAIIKHFGVKVIKQFAVLCINAAVTGVTISNCNKFYAFTFTDVFLINLGRVFPMPTIRRINNFINAGAVDIIRTAYYIHCLN